MFSFFKKKPPPPAVVEPAGPVPEAQSAPPQTAPSPELPVSPAPAAPSPTAGRMGWFSRLAQGLRKTGAGGGFFLKKLNIRFRVALSRWREH